MTQPSFNFEVPRSRRTDPLSSKRAEDQMRRSGALKGQRLIALELVKQFPGRSSKELAKLGTLDRYQLARRLPELVSLGHVRVTQTGNDDQKWWAAL
jgi:hypothetical protein